MALARADRYFKGVRNAANSRARESGTIDDRGWAAYFSRKTVGTYRKITGV